MAPARVEEVELLLKKALPELESPAPESEVENEPTVMSEAPAEPAPLPPAKVN